MSGGVSRLAKVAIKQFVRSLLLSSRRSVARLQRLAGRMLNEDVSASAERHGAALFHYRVK